MVNPLQAFASRFRQEYESLDKDTLPNPLAGVVGPAQVHYNPLRDIPVVGGLINRTVNAPLHAVGLTTEGGNAVAQGVAGTAAYLMAQIVRAARAAGNDGQPNAMADLAEQIATTGPMHPGRNIDAMRHSANPIVSLSGGALEMLANPLNYTNTIGGVGAGLEASGAAPRLGAALKGLATAGEIANRAPLAPLALIPKARAALTETPAFLRPAGQAVSPALASALGKLGELERPPLPPPVDLGALRGGQVGAAKPLGLPLIPEPLDLRLAQRERGIPQATRVPDLGDSPLAPDKTPNLLAIARQAQNAAERGPVQGPQRMPGPILPLPTDRPAPIQGLGDLVGAARKTAQPNPLEQLAGVARRLGLDMPAALPDTPATAQLPLPEPGAAAAALPPARTDLVKAVANGPVANLTAVLRDLHGAVYPNGQTDFAIPSLTGQAARDFRTTFLTDHPTGNVAEPYLDYLIARVQGDGKAAARLAERNPALAADLQQFPPSGKPVEEMKRALQAGLGAGPFKATEAAPVGPGATEIARAADTPALAAATTDGAQGFADLIASRDNGKMGAYLPGAEFFAKRLGIPAAEAQGYIDDLVRRGVVADERGALAFRPDAPAVDNAAQALPAAVEDTIARGNAAKADLFGDAADVAGPAASDLPTGTPEPWQLPRGDAYEAYPNLDEQFRPPNSTTVYAMFDRFNRAMSPKSGLAVPLVRGDKAGTARMVAKQAYADAKRDLLDTLTAATQERYLYPREARDRVLAAFDNADAKLTAYEQAFKGNKSGEDFPAMRQALSDFVEETLRAHKYGDIINDPHRYLVEQAVREGKDVPAAVLADYPDLAPKRAGGDIAAGGGGMGLLPYPGGLTGPIGRAIVPAAAGGIAGAGAGAAIGAATTPEDRVGGALKGGLIGAGVGYAGAGGASMAGLDTAVKQALPKYVSGSMLDPGMYADAAQAFLRGMEEARAAGGVKGAGKVPSSVANQWRAQMVMTLKQIPQDALTRAFTMWGVAAKEFGATGADLRRWQQGLRQERAAGVSMLDNPVTAKLRALGLQSKLADLGETYGLDFARTQASGRELGGAGRALAGAGFSLASPATAVNPLAPVIGAVRGYYQPGINAFVGFLNGIQHDAFRFALAEKALDRDVPHLANDFLSELARAGHNVKPLEGKGGFFSPADVAKVAGPQAAKDWAGLTEALVQGQGDRIAFLGGDFRQSAETGAERAVGKVAPFSRWAIRYAPVLAEIAIRHPRAALIAGRELNRQAAEAKQQGKRSYQKGYTITDTTPLVGLAARARNGGAPGSLTVDPLGALVPYGDLLGGGEDLPADATGYQRAVDAASRVGFAPNPLIQSLAYIAGQDFRTPSNLSRTAGLEAGVGAVPAAARLAGYNVPDLPQLPSGRQLLDAGREVLSPVTGQHAVSSTEPEVRRYAELVLARTGVPLMDPRNRAYVESMGEPDNQLWNLAVVQARTAGAATNATGLVSPVQTTAQTGEGAQAQAAGKLPVTDYQISQAPKSQQPGLRAALDRVIAQNPAIATYRNISPSARKQQQVAEWEQAHARQKQIAPALYAERLKAFKESLR